MRLPLADIPGALLQPDTSFGDYDTRKVTLGGRYLVVQLLVDAPAAVVELHEFSYG
jgi:hypothetical protein